jgi:amino acid adenylation domain-containing protein
MPPLGSTAPLSFAQERLWFIDAAGGGATYNVPLLLRWTEPVNAHKLAVALAEVAGRHDVLRTTYELRDGAPVQVVRPAGPVPVEVRPGHEGWYDEALRVAREPFDLTAEPPVRCVVWQGLPGGDAMLLSVHHIAIDGWSSGPLFAELAAAYDAAIAGRAADLAPLPARYADFAARDRAAFAEPAVSAHLDRRVGELLRVPGDLALAGRGAARDTGGSRPGAQHTFTLTSRAWARVGGFAAEVRVTPAVVLFAAFQAVLKRWSERDEFVVGLVTANRTDPDFERLVGFFVNTVPLLCAVPAGASFRELCTLTRRESFAALTHQRLPYEKVLAATRARGGDNLVTVAFGLQNMPAPDYAVPPRWTTPRLLPTGTAKYEVLLLFEEDGAELMGTVEVDTSRYPAELAARLAENVTVLLEAALANPDHAVAALPVSRRRTVVCGPSRRHEDTTVVDAVARRLAAVDPDAPAVSVRDNTVTWRELDRWAWAVAAAVPRGVPHVPVLAARGGGMAAAWLGVLRTGAAYAPLGVDVPPSRAEHILRETGAEAVLADAEGAALLAGMTVSPKVIRIDSLRHTGTPPTPPATPAPESTAVLLYTSGTTGRPKGIMIPHRGLLNTVLWWAEELALTPEDRVLCTWSTQFDMATFDTFRCLVSGAHLVYADDVDRRDPHALLRLIRSATVMSGTPSLLRAMLAADTAPRPGTTLRAITAAGEALPHHLVRECQQRWDVPTHNLYGPAEVSGASTGAVVGPDDKHPTIGRPLPNNRCHVLGRDGEELPEGVPGELYMAGAGVSTGYLAQPARTAAAFVPDPDDPGLRMYRTGDRVAVRPDGRLDYLGRYDHQVKILGNRVEPDEVRALLEEQPAVQSAAVVPEGDPQRLVAYVVLSKKDAVPTRTELVTPLLRWLPSPVLPTQVYVVDEIPLNTNDKTDFHALRATRGAPLPTDAGTTSLTPPEQQAATIITAVAGTDDEPTTLTPETSFFSIGGHSLAAIEIVTEATRRHNTTFTLRDFLADPTVAGLGRLLARQSTTPPTTPTPPTARHAHPPAGGPSPTVQRSMPDSAVAEPDCRSASESSAPPTTSVPLSAGRAHPSGGGSSTGPQLTPDPAVAESDRLPAGESPVTTSACAGDSVVAGVPAGVSPTTASGVAPDSVVAGAGGVPIDGASAVARGSAADPMVVGAGRAGAGELSTSPPPAVPEVSVSAGSVEIGGPLGARVGLSYPATSVQQRLWFIDRITALRTAYLIPILIELTGSVDHARLRDATALVLARHPALRSRFVLDHRRRRVLYRTDGAPPSVEIVFGIDGLREFCWAPFDLAVGPPARARIIVDGERTVLAVVTHHIVFDGWSFGVLFGQIGDAYRGVELPPPVHPADLGDGAPADVTAVVERLRGAPTDVELPLAAARPALQLVDADILRSTIDSGITARLRGIAGALGCSVFVTGAALLAATLARYSRQRDFLIAFPWAGRERAESVHAVGMFVNTLVLRADLRDGPTWRQLLTRIRDDVQAAYRAADVPFDDVVAALHPDRDLSRPPLTPVYFGAFDGDPALPELGAGTAARYLPLPGTTVKYELEVTVTDRGDELVLAATYPTELWSATTVTELLESFVDATALLVADPDAVVLVEGTP